jgi:superfamily II helicase
LKAVGEASPDFLAAVWQMVASRSKLLPPLETVRDNVILGAILAEMEKRGYVTKDGERYRLTEEGKAVAADVWVPPDVERLKTLRYVTPAFYAVLNTSASSV